MHRAKTRRISFLLLLLTLLTCAQPLAALAVTTPTQATASSTTSVLTDPAIAATAAVLYDPQGSTFLYEKEANAKRYPASTTKIMTALLVLENVTDLNEKITMTQDDFVGVEADSSKAGFLVGEEVPVIDMLYGLLLPSGNEAANALARHVGGSIDAFVTMMNTRAAQLGCTGTHFANPNGLHDENHYTTAHDLSLIAAKAMENETFSLISNTAQKTLSETNMKAQHGNKALKVFTTNMLIYSRNDPNYYAYAKGIKTGHTTPAGYCLVAAAEKKGGMLISVVLGCEKPQGASQPVTFSETKRLFEWGFTNFETRTLITKGQTVAQIPVELSTDTDALVPQVAQSLSALVPKDLDSKDLTLTMQVPESLRAPIAAGDVVGTMEISYNGTIYGTVDLISMTDISLSSVLYYADKLNYFFQSVLFKAIVLVICGLLVLYILYFSIIGRRKRRKKQRMLRSRTSRYRKYK